MGACLYRGQNDHAVNRVGLRRWLPVKGLCEQKFVYLGDKLNSLAPLANFAYRQGLRRRFQLLENRCATSQTSRPRYMKLLAPCKTMK